MDDNTTHEPTAPNPDPTEGPSAEELKKRLEELEQELARTRAQRDEYKASTYSLLEQIVPYTPLTPEEVEDMLHGPRGQPIIEIIEEYEKLLSGEKQ